MQSIISDLNREECYGRSWLQDYEEKHDAKFPSLRQIVLLTLNRIEQVLISQLVVEAIYVNYCLSATDLFFWPAAHSMTRVGISTVRFTYFHIGILTMLR